MGCDIHSRAEMDYGEEAWEGIDKALWPYPYFREDEGVNLYNVPYTNQPFHDRQYDLFALLANVRNYYNIEPFSEPRGVPEDASKEWRAVVEDWAEDMHSHSWITAREVRELLEKSYNRRVEYSGYVSRNQYLDYVMTGTTPSSWAGGVGGPNVVTIDADDVGEPNDIPANVTHVYMSWRESMNVGVINTLKQALQPFEYLFERDEKYLDRIRFVFGFDN